MADDEQTKMHYSRCSYKRCGSNSRDNVPGINFYAMPVNESERCITWLVNSGIDHYVELRDSELKNVKICGRHFSPTDTYPGGRLKKTAVPELYPVSDSEDEDTSTRNAPAAWEIERAKLVKTIKYQNRAILKLEHQNKLLRRTVKARTAIIRKFRYRLNKGVIPNLTLAKAVARKVQNFVLTFVLMQLFRTSSSTQKYTEQEKQMALKMHYTSPSLYQKMREDFNFTLPSYSTIKNWFGNIELWPGICPKMFDHLKIEVDSMNQWERQCMLLFDEVQIKKAFDLHDGKQKIEGFEDLGSFGCSSGVATHALVFMVRGMFCNWKQPIAYFLSAGVCKSRQLSDILDSVLDAVISAGLRIRGIVCDQGTQNQSIINERVTAEQPFFIYKGLKLFTFFDWSHLGKGLRNQLIAHNFAIVNSEHQIVVSWRDIEALWNLEKNSMTRAACKLSAKHIYPSTFERMKCRLAFQVFSRRVSAALLTAAATGGIRSETVTATANFLRVANDLFDNLNSRTAIHSNPNKCALSEARPNVEENLREQLDASKNWHTITDKGFKKPPCFTGLRLSLNALLQLWDDLKLEGAKYLLTSRLNQDPLENLFSMIRMHGGSYDPNPSAKIFRLSLQKNIIMNLVKPAQTANCEGDEDETLIQQEEYNSQNKQDLTLENASSAKEYVTRDEDPLYDMDVEKIVIDASDYSDSLESCAIEYFSGYVLKKCIEKSNCDTCKALMVDSSQCLANNKQMLTFFRAYATLDNSELGHLCVASDEFSMAFRTMNAVFDNGYPRIRSQYLIQDQLFSLIVLVWSLHII